jgi:signal transduction histidine kinase
VSLVPSITALDRPAGTTLEPFRLTAERSSAPVAIVEVDTGAVIYANRALSTLLGHAEGGLHGRDVRALCSDAERLLAAVAASAQVQALELVPDLHFTANGGEIIAVHSFLQPLGRKCVAVALSPTGAVIEASGQESNVDLLRANERLLIASLREQELAEQVRTAHRELQRVLERKSLLAEANALLSSTLETGETLRKVAALAVPELADCSVVQLFVDGGLERIECAHAEQTIEVHLASPCQELARDVDLVRISARVRETGKAAVFPDLESVDAELGSATSGSSILRDMNASSYLMLPLKARGQLIGLLTLVSCGPERRYQLHDVEFALELARRASVALDNARLYEEAQRAIRSREDVLAIVSHDLRSPLSAIMLTAGRLMKGTVQPDSLARGMQLVRRSAMHMHRLVEELLDVASLQSGQLALNLRAVDVLELIDEAVEMVEPTATRKAVVLEKSEHPGPLVVDCDRERIMRVLVNLLGNAVKFTDEGGRVAVAASVRAGEIHVSVRDTGPGISKAELSKLFERYWKGSTKGRGGMGLGLYIARGIVQAHRGTITVESALGQGSTFTFTLPATFHDE